MSVDRSWNCPQQARAAHSSQRPIDLQAWSKRHQTSNSLISHQNRRWIWRFISTYAPVNLSRYKWCRLVVSLENDDDGGEHEAEQIVEQASHKARDDGSHLHLDGRPHIHKHDRGDVRGHDERALDNVPRRVHDLHDGGHIYNHVDRHRGAHGNGHALAREGRRGVVGAQHIVSMRAAHRGRQQQHGNHQSTPSSGGQI